MILERNTPDGATLVTTKLTYHLTDEAKFTLEQPCWLRSLSLAVVEVELAEHLAVFIQSFGFICKPE